MHTGDLLGYQGNYSGNPGNPTGVHLHFSIVRDDGSGKYLNELEFANTLDPSTVLQSPFEWEKQQGYNPALFQRRQLTRLDASPPFDSQLPQNARARPWHVTSG